MNVIKNIFKIIKRPSSISIAVLLVIVFLVLAISWVLYNNTVNILTQNLKDRLITISITQAANIDAKDLQALQTQNDWIKPEWARVVNKLHRSKYSNDQIVFMYIFRKTKDDPTKMELVTDADSIDPYANITNDPSGATVLASACPKCVDSNRDGKVEPNGPDKLQWPGQPFPEIADVPEAFEAYNGPLTVKDIYTDEYGSVLTGFAPIKDENGVTVAILGTDIKADDFLTITKQTLYPFLEFIAALTLIIAILAGSLIFIWSRRANMLARLSRSLEVANKQQENLLHFISHEIKGYLTKGESAFAELASGDYGTLPDNAKKLATGALLEMRKGVDTVMNILDASNLKKGAMTFRKSPFDFREVVERVFSEQQSAASEKSLDFTIEVEDGPYTVIGDENRMHDDVIRNLIGNAIVYTPRGSVHIRLWHPRPHLSVGANCAFSVKDSGVGISPEDKQHLFTEGGHGKDSIKVNVHSTGYGLFIAKTIVDAHGGKIWAESEGVGKGSTFVVELPAA